MTALPSSIKQIIKELERNPGTVNNTKLKKIVQSGKIDEHELLRFSDFNHCPTKSYGRSTLFQGKYFGVYIMSWSPGDFTAIHCHGHSEWGIVCFFGNADHRTYTVEGKKIKLKTSEILSKGTIAAIKGNFVHAMGNLSDNSFITLHIYGSNSFEGVATEDSKVYEIEKNRIRTTYGPAYVNISDDLCKNDEEGILTDEKTRNDHKKIIQEFYRRNKIPI